MAFRTDTVLLQKRIDESGYKLRFIASKCGLTYAGLLPKLRGERQFTQGEIIALCQLLELSDKDMRQIFFAREVHEK